MLLAQAQLTSVKIKHIYPPNVIHWLKHIYPPNAI